ncbi:MAG: glycosyltransferase, partial [Waterburya sp.]
KQSIETQVETFCRTKPVQIIGHYQFVPEQDVSQYFQLADFVLAPYQKHIGMSGILLLAAAAQKPILSSNYGLMGELVRQYQLGLTVDSTLPQEIADGITECLHKSPEQLGDRQKMKTFAEQNSAERFAQVIVEHLAS